MTIVEALSLYQYGFKRRRADATVRFIYLTLFSKQLLFLQISFIF